MNGYYGYQPYYQPPAPSYQLPASNYMQNNNYMQPRTLSGSTGTMRVVDDFGSITANEIPMDGSVAVFLKADNSEIQVKEWTANGTINTTAYKPILKAKPDAGGVAADDSFAGLFEAKMSDIGERLSKIEGALMLKPAKKGRPNEPECDT